MCSIISFDFDNATGNARSLRIIVLLESVANRNSNQSRRTTPRFINYYLLFNKAKNTVH